MKRLILSMACAAIISTSAIAQKVAEANVPPAVLTKFSSTFSASEPVSWEMDYDNYVAKFKNNKVQIEVTYNKDGNWIKTETPISHSALPASVKSCLTRQFDIYNENDIEKVDSPQGTTYSIDVECKQLNYEVVISDQGDLVSKDEVKEYKRDE